MYKSMIQHHRRDGFVEPMIALAKVLMELGKDREAMQWCLNGLVYKPWQFDLVTLMLELCRKHNQVEHALYWSTWYALPPCGSETQSRRMEWVQRAIHHAQLAYRQESIARDFVRDDQQQQQWQQSAYEQVMSEQYVSEGVVSSSISHVVPSTTASGVYGVWE